VTVCAPSQLAVASSRHKPAVNANRDNEK
jgi:hypothetical protein